MPSNADVVRQVARLLMARPEVRDRARRARSEGVGVSRRPNAPKLVTIFVAVGLTLVGLAVTETVAALEPVVDWLAEADVTLTEEQGWLALLLSPVLLVVGSFFRGI